MKGEFGIFELGFAECVEWLSVGDSRLASRWRRKWQLTEQFRETQAHRSKRTQGS